MSPAEAPLCYDGAMRPALVAVLLLLSSPALAQIEGRARAVSGDVLEMGGRPVVLHGIDAPEPEQTCERGGRTWTCGLQAAFALAGLVERHWLTCVAHGRDEAGRVTAVCRMGGPAGVEVNARMVAEGWALAEPATGGAYVGAQEQARAAGLGLWSGRFVAPWEWRQGRR